MSTLIPYLNFPGTCEEAMNFYAKALGGQLGDLMRYDSAGGPVDEDKKNWVMHSVVTAGDITLMAADSAHGPVSNGNQVTLNLAYTDTAKQAEVFAKLSEGGTVTMPLEKTFWGAIFGMCTDKFGINWMTNCEVK